AVRRRHPEASQQPTSHKQTEGCTDRPLVLHGEPPRKFLPHHAPSAERIFWRKYSRVRLSPYFRSILGSQPSSRRARSISGWCILGSSCGNDLKTSGLRLSVKARISWRNPERALRADCRDSPAHGSPVLQGGATGLTGANWVISGGGEYRSSGRGRG